MSTPESKRLARLAKKASDAEAATTKRRGRLTGNATHENGQAQVTSGVVDGKAPAMHGTERKGAKKVVVACKLPHGLRLRLQHFIEMPEAVSGGGTKMVKRSQYIGPEFVIKGFSQPIGNRPDYRIIGDYALTPGIDKDFFEQWLEQNKDLPAVVNKLIYCHAEEASVVDFAKENAKRASGLEPLAQDDDPRATKPAHKKLSKVKPDAERMEEAKAG